MSYLGGQFTGGGNWVPNDEAPSSYFTVFGLTQPGIEHVISRLQVGHDTAKQEAQEGL